MEIRKEKNMKKKITALLLACTLAGGMTICPVGPAGLETVWADDEDENYEEDEEVEFGDWKYKSDGENGIIITEYNGSETELTEEDLATIDGKTVTGIGNNAFNGCSSLTNIGIPASVTSIGQFAFSGCSSLTSIEIPASVTGIESFAFNGCSSLTSIEIPASVTSIESSVFENCSSLISIKLPNSITSIEYGAFESCSSLTSIEIPASVTSMDNNPFKGCIKLESVTVDEGNPNYVSHDGVVYNKEETTLISCPGGKKVITILSSVTSIGVFAFTGCKSLTSIELPSSVTNISSSAFAGCSSLANIELPNSVTSIGLWAFQGCSSLTSIEIPNGVTSICESTFERCSNLTSIKIPSSVTSIGYDAFWRCDNLKDIYYGGTQEQWNAIQIYEARISESVTIHFNSSTGESGNNPNTPPNNDPNKDLAGTQKSDQVITAKDITKTYGAKAFSLNAKVNTGTALTYASSDKKVATIDQKGKITIKGCGITNITITAPETDAYNQAQKTIKLTVKPKKVSLFSVKSTKKKTATVKWKQDKKATGYLIQCATDKKFKKNKVQVTVGKNKTVSTTVKKLKAGKKYYVRVCAYAKSGKTKVQGDWSKVKTVTIKK